ncbi:MAG: effector-associated domain EAD1-containing protein [Chloroflexota bacterium]
MNQPTPHQLKQLEEALLDAFDHSALSQLASRLGRSLEWDTPVHGQRSLTVVVSELVAPITPAKTAD